jgi:hypothetical protein
MPRRRPVRLGLIAPDGSELTPSLLGCTKCGEFKSSSEFPVTDLTTKRRRVNCILCERQRQTLIRTPARRASSSVAKKRCACSCPCHVKLPPPPEIYMSALRQLCLLGRDN